MRFLNSASLAVVVQLQRWYLEDSTATDAGVAETDVVEEGLLLLVFLGLEAQAGLLQLFGAPHPGYCVAVVVLTPPTGRGPGGSGTTYGGQIEEVQEVVNVAAGEGGGAASGWPWTERCEEGEATLDEGVVVAPPEVLEQLLENEEGDLVSEQQEIAFDDFPGPGPADHLGPVVVVVVVVSLRPCVLHHQAVEKEAPVCCCSRRLLRP
jgi:hypothetical protein